MTRIIPARAGFTRRARPRWWRSQDHPRSRGVYVLLTGQTDKPIGSSPLARGLPGGTQLVAGTAGIIPARAGFTVGLWCGCAVCGDHPRSRGVYGRLPARAPRRPGSSPLARGLRLEFKLGRSGPRIIPARAGFTRAARPTLPDTRDHPRSRGVYLPVSSLRSEPAGSSPLARGLPRRSSIYTQPYRIIPARAGFTLISVHLTPQSRDHPRSRGVYAL